MSTRPAQPWRMPMTSKPSRSARNVTPRIAGLRPGTSPPPVRMPMMPFLVLTLAMLSPQGEFELIILHGVSRKPESKRTIQQGSEGYAFTAEARKVLVCVALGVELFVARYLRGTTG